jgi:4-coumarate--CoA ligase
MTTYHSNTLDVVIPDVSLFTFLFEGKIDKEISGATPAFIDEHTQQHFTRSQFKSACLSLCWGLRNVFAKKLKGVKLTRGDMVMIFSPNSLAWPLALFASIAAGFKTTFADPLLTSEKLAPRWKDSGAKVVFTDRALVPVVVEMLEKSGVSKEEARKRIIIMGVEDKDATTDGFTHMDDLRGRGGQAERFDGTLSNETVFLCYSSGTTGEPKGVEVSLPSMVNWFCSVF